MEHYEGTLVGQGGLDLFYQHWRPPTSLGVKAVLALVHGFGEHSGRYLNVVEWFVPKGYAVHAFDLRGCGRSPGQRGYLSSFADYRSDVQAFLSFVQQTEPERPVFLVGHSQGGLLVLNYVLHRPPELAGIVTSGPLLSQLPISPLLVAAAKLLSRVWPRFTLESGLDATALSRDTAVVEAYVNDPLVCSKGTTRLAAEVMATIDWTHAHAADLSLPCLIVHGGADRLSLPEASQVFFENVAFDDKERYVYDGYYHEVFNDLGKERVLADVEDWLERHQNG